MALLWIAAASVAGLILLIARFRLNAFVALLLACLFVGIASGTELPRILEAMAGGLAGVLGPIAFVIGLGAILGKLLAESGGAAVVAGAFLRWFGEGRVDWAMMFVGLTIGIAVWFTVGLVLLMPIACTLARQTGRSLLLPGIPMLAGLAVMHGLAPPHPGPMVAIGLLGADTGKTILWSMVIGLPLAALAGPVCARIMAERVVLAPRAVDIQWDRGSAARTAPGLALTLFTIALPVLLMLSTMVVALVMPEGRLGAHSGLGGAPGWWAGARDSLAGLRPWLALVGSPTVAMLIAVLFSLYSFGFARGLDAQQIAKCSEASLAPIGMILLVVGAGGAFSKVLDVCGVGKAVTAAVMGAQLSPLLLGWFLAAMIRVAVGSATVAISTAAGLVAPVAAATPGTHLELVVIAMGAGSLVLSHVNDGGFWFVKEYFGMTVPQTLRTWTVLVTIVALGALPLLMLLDRLL